MRCRKRQVCACNRAKRQESQGRTTPMPDKNKAERETNRGALETRGRQKTQRNSRNLQLSQLKPQQSGVLCGHKGIQIKDKCKAGYIKCLSLNPPVSHSCLQEIFPVYFGSKYDAALEMLVWEFISRLEELLPVPDFTQVPRFFELQPCRISGTT